MQLSKTSVVLGLALGLFVMGCPGPKDKTGEAKGGDKASAPAKPGGDSPEEVWKLATAAGEKGDAKAMMALFLPKMHKELCGMAASMAKAPSKKEGAQEAMKKICADHNIKTDIEIPYAKGKEEVKKATDKIVADVKDPLAAATAVMVWMGKYTDKDPMARKPIGGLTEKKMDGDNKCTAKVKFKKGDKDLDDTQKFEKVDGRWYMGN